jgi:uncharacterized protein
MNAKEMEILHRLKSLLQEKVKLDRVVLFGSRARGNSDPESDMDVLILINEPLTSEVRDKVSDCAWEAGFEDGIVVASLVYTKDEWENGPEHYSPFAETVRSEGIPV